MQSLRHWQARVTRFIIRLTLVTLIFVNTAALIATRTLLWMADSSDPIGDWHSLAGVRADAPGYAISRFVWPAAGVGEPRP